MVTVRDRAEVVRRVCRLVARDAAGLAETVTRATGETLTAEVLPLAAAASFLARQAPRLLASRAPKGSRPAWLMGVRADIRRVPLGAVLVIGPGNFPLFLPGAQALHAVAAGNAVRVKPAPGCAAPMRRLGALLAEAGVPDGVFGLLPDSPEAGAAAVSAGFDHIVLTGSAATGGRVLEAAAATLTPTTMELSGNDAVFILPGADLTLAADAIAYGLRLNGGAVCLSPRRVFVPHASAAALEAALAPRLAALPAVGRTDRLEAMLAEARARGARVTTHPGATVVADARAELALLREDVFAPVVSLVPIADISEAVRLDCVCPYALGASIFGPVADARALAGRLRAGSVTINDVIVPTADPRLPFGGRWAQRLRRHAGGGGAAGDDPAAGGQRPARPVPAAPGAAGPGRCRPVHRPDRPRLRRLAHPGESSAGTHGTTVNRITDVVPTCPSNPVGRACRVCGPGERVSGR